MTADEAVELIHLLYLHEYAEERLAQVITDHRYHEGERGKFWKANRQLYALALGFRWLLRDSETALLRHPYVRAGLANGFVDNDHGIAIAKKTREWIEAVPDRYYTSEDA